VDSVGYIVAQLMGAIAAALALAAVLGGVAIGLGTPALAHDLALGTTTTVTITPAAGFAIEALLAFLLLTTVLSTAVAGRDGNLAPLVIGVTVTVDRVMTATAFNPARAIGPMIVTGKLDHLWLYVLAPGGRRRRGLGPRALARLAGNPLRQPLRPPSALRIPFEWVGRNL
jgi:glycerol uptake facilitator-like aquaporin